MLSLAQLPKAFCLDICQITENFYTYSVYSTEPVFSFQAISRVGATGEVFSWFFFRPQGSIAVQILFCLPTFLWKVSFQKFR